jgi:uncharacterized protein
VSLVSNAGPLISLGRIGKLSLLPAAYSGILVPRAVFEEVTRDRQLPGARELAEASWLHVVEVFDRPAVERLYFWLDRGESEAIVLAQARGIPLAIDEQRGRRIATSLGVATTGTIGILLAAKRLGLIEQVTPLLEALRAQGIRMSPGLYENARSLAGES